MSNQSTVQTISFRQLWQHEWHVKHSNKITWLYPLVMFIIILILFPLTLGSDTSTLHSVGVPAVWIACLLSLSMGADDIFGSAYDNGILIQLFVTKSDVALWALIRLSIHWLFSAGMMSILSILAMPFFGLNMIESIILLLSILVASPILLALLAIIGTLTISVHRGSFLIPLLAIPLQLPILIFATSTVRVYTLALNIYHVLPILALLLSGSIVTVIITPWVIQQLLKKVYV